MKEIEYYVGSDSSRKASSRRSDTELCEVRSPPLQDAFQREIPELDVSNLIEPSFVAQPSFVPFMNEHSNVVESSSLDENYEVEGPTLLNKSLREDSRYFENNLWEVNAPGIRNSLGTFAELHSMKNNPELLKDFLVMRQLTSYELIDKMEDTYPCLSLRKALLRIKSSISQLCRVIIESPVFETIIILIILANTVVLALEDPNGNESSPEITAINNFFLYAYTVEALLKIGGMGLFFSTGAYLKDKWNILDFIIVASGWVSELGQEGLNLNALRTLRVLRPLRSITSIPSLRVLFIALMNSARPLFAALIVLSFFLLIFAIAGVHLLMGSFKFRCMDLETGVLGGDSELCGFAGCGVLEECGKGLENPNYGNTNFDNIFYASLAVFQSVTLEGWTGIMIFSQKSFNFYSIFYFVPLISIGAFLLLNLTLAVVKESFSQAMNKMNNKSATEDLEESIDGSFLSKVTSGNFINTGKVAPQENDSNESEESDELEDSVGSSDPQKEKIPKLNHQDSPTDQNLVEESTKTPKTQKPIESRFVISTFNHKSFNPAQTEPKKNSIDQDSRSLQKKATDINNGEKLSKAKLVDSKSFREDLIQDKDLGKKMLRRIRTSLKVKKNVLDILKQGSDLDRVKFTVSENQELTKNSDFEILPPERGVETLYKVHPGNSEYSFSYCCFDELPEVDILEVHRNEDLEATLEKYSKVGNRFAIFSHLHQKIPFKEAFSQLVVKGSKQIFETYESDRLTKRVFGVWSGHQVGNLSSGSNMKEVIESLSSMKYRLWKPGILGLWQKFRYPVRSVVKNSLFDSSMTVAVMVNTIVLALDHYGISTEMEDALTTMNFVFTIIFIVEMCLKLIGLGLRGYLGDPMNYFDGVVVLLSIVELVFLTGSSTISAFRAIRIFKVIRVLRVARLFRYMQSMVMITKVMSQSFSKFINLALLLLLFILIFALLGMQLFSGRFDFEEGVPRSNFDSFHWAFVTIFQVLSMENWQDVLYSAMRSSAGPFSSLFLIVWVFFGNFVLLNLFLAILLDSFNNVDEEDEENTSVDTSTTQFTQKKSILGSTAQKKEKKRQEQKFKLMEDLVNQKSENSLSSGEERPQQNNLPETQCERSFYVFSKANKFRVLCQRASASSRFEQCILVLIITGSVKLVWDTYLLNKPSDSVELQVSGYLDLFFSLSFTIEFLIKAVSLGFVVEKGTYLRDSWNRLDFLIVIFSWSEFFLSELEMPIIKVFRLVRILRPLRFISHNLSMKIVVTALLESIAAIVNVVVVLMVIWLIFAILGVSLFGGKMYSCENPNIKTQNDCEAYGYEWKNADSNFDNVIEAMMTLFIVSSLEGWPTIMYQTVDAVEEGKAPEKNYNPAAAYYFIAFILIGSFFFLNFFIGVVFQEFMKAKKNESSLVVQILTKEQVKWVELQKLITKSKPHLPISGEAKGVFRTRVHKLVKHWGFDAFIQGCIVLNMIQMAIVYDGASQEYMETLEYINLGFTFVFIVEAGLKNIAFGPAGYFKNSWNRFDFFVVIASVLDICLSYFVQTSTNLLRIGPQVARILRVLRISRTIRIARSLNEVHELMMIIVYSLPAMLNVLSLLLLIFFIYAVLGVYLFNSITQGSIIDEYNNFSNFGMAMVMLLRVSTGEEWNLIMYDCMQNYNSIVPGLYFGSFTIITMFVMLNMFVMVLIQNYEDYKQNPESVLNVFNKDVKHFRALWSHYTHLTEGTRMNYKYLVDLMQELEHGLGVESTLEHDKVIKILSTMDLNIDYDGYVYYNDMLYAVLKRKYGKNLIKHSYSKNLNGKFRKLVLSKQEKTCKKKLGRIREKARVNFYPSSRADYFRGMKSFNLFFTMIYAKTIFRSWKNYTKAQKCRSSGQVSLEPTFSELFFPGENSFNSSYKSLHSSLDSRECLSG